MVSICAATERSEADKKMDDGIEETLTYCNFPSEHWARIRTNNVIERLKCEIHRRTRMVGTIQDDNSAIMLVCVRLVMWLAPSGETRKYMNMKYLEAPLKDASIIG